MCLFCVCVRGMGEGGGGVLALYPSFNDELFLS